MIVLIQLQFLNYVLATRDKNIFDDNNITQEFFSAYKNEFDYIKDHIDTYGCVPDYETFLSVFSGFEVVEVHETLPYLIDALYEDRNRRVLADGFNKIRKQLNEGDTDGAYRTYDGLQTSLKKAVRVEYTDLFKDTSRYDHYIDKCQNFTKSYVTTGLPELDRLIGGFDRDEELCTVVARTSVGKTWYLTLSAVAAAKKGLTVGFYSGEMSKDKIGYRMDTLISHISNSSLMHGNINVQVEYKKYIEKLGENCSGTIKVLTTDDLNGSFANINDLLAFVNKAHLDMLCIDQHSLLEDMSKERNPVTRAANISMALKKLQRKTKIPIISACQQNRVVNEGGVDTTNIAQSDRIGQDSTVVIFLEKKDDILTITTGKARDGGDGKKLKYAFDYDKGIFSYIPTEDDALGGSDCEDLRKQYESEEVSGEEVF